MKARDPANGYTQPGCGRDRRLGGYKNPISNQIAFTIPWAAGKETKLGSSMAMTRFSQA